MNGPLATAILLAGGSSTRMQGQIADKILEPISGKPAILHCMEAFHATNAIHTFVIVHRDATQRCAIEELLPLSNVSIRWALGGTERKDSVWAGLQATSEETEIALIHDCARPCVTPQAIRESIDQARKTGAACLAHPVANTIKLKNGNALETLDRSKLWATETPQTFRYPLIRDAYQQIIANGQPITDDLSAIESQDIPIIFIDNGQPNPKLTTPHDLAYAEMILTQTKNGPA